MTKVAYTRDSLEVILSQLSTKVVHAISDGHYLRNLNFLLEFFAAWEKRPVNLTSMAYEWFCAISEVVIRLGPGEIPISGIPISGEARTHGYGGRDSSSHDPHHKNAETNFKAHSLMTRLRISSRSLSADSLESGLTLVRPVWTTSPFVLVRANMTRPSITT